MVKYGKVFTAKKGKYKGKKVKYSYGSKGRKSDKKMVLHRAKRRY
jgi:hypothetical protein